MSPAFALLALVGATLIVVRGTIFRRVQKLWPPLFQCSQCAGFWVGALAGASGVVQASGNGRIVDAIFFGAATSGASLLADALLLRLLGDPDQES